MPATRSLDEYLDLPYPIGLTRGDGEEPWIARLDDLPGCQARGASPEEAAARVLEAMGEWIGAALAEGRPVPEPRPALSGRLLVRMPRTLHADLARAAAREQVSLNQFVTSALSAAVTWRQSPVSRAPASPPLTLAAVRAPERTGTASGHGLRRLLVADLLLVACAVVIAVVLLLTSG